MGEFEGKSVIVTGGALGMGGDTAVEFARAGAKVAIADINEVAAAATLEKMAAAGTAGIFIHGDVSQAAACRRVVSEAAGAFGGVDILFNNVGIQPPDSYTNVEGTSEELWDRIIGVNLKSRFLMAKYVIPEMRKRGGGVIVNNASVQGQQSMPGVPAYAASKGGDLSLTRQMSLDYAAENIRVMAICPGTIDTEMVRSIAREEIGSHDEDAVAERVAQYGKDHPLGRVGTGLDIANAVMFLASEKASFMTGSFINVDGGYMAMGSWASGAGADA
ncbi:MAG: glucose 1-dehydrogenase [Chloroflexi bacterium]|nr:glucose 1-dehydrogenase [Chloroflexota bacterium]